MKLVSLVRWSSAISLVTVALLVVIAILTINKMDREIHLMTEQSNKIGKTSDHLGILALTMRRYEKDIFLNIGKPEKQEGYLKKFQSTSDTIHQEIAVLKMLVKGTEEWQLQSQQLLRESEKSFDKYFSSFLELANAAIADPTLTPQEGNKRMIPFKEHIYAFENGIAGLMKKAKTLSDQRTIELLDAADLGRRVLIIAACLTLLITTAAGITASIRIHKGFRAFVNPVRNISENLDLTEHVSAQSKDEFGELAGYFNNLIEQVRGIIGSIQESSESIVQTSVNLHESAVAFNSETDKAKQESQIANSSLHDSTEEIATIAAAVEEMSANMNTVSASIEEFNASLSSIAEYCQKENEITSEAEKRASEAIVAVDSLAELSKNMGSILGSIDDIASQTNLLALNATIEAASAGEHGKGFAVVASEVKELAKATTQATSEIVEKMGQTESSANQAVVAIREIGKIISEISEGSSQLLRSVDEQTLSIREISKSAAFVGETSDSVSGNVSKMSQNILSVSESVNGVNLGIGKIGDEASGINRESDQLTNVATDLKVSIERFVV